MAGTVVTISRQMGSGGDVIAGKLAESLGVQLLDRQILEAAAMAADVAPDAIEEAEKAPPLLERVLEYLARSSAAMELGPDYSMDQSFAAPLTRDDYRHLMEQVLLRRAMETDAVIVGHGGFVVLKSLPHVLKVLVCAPFSVRVERLREFERTSQEEARQWIHDDDQARAGYFRTYYGIDWLHPGHYDLCINAGRIDTVSAVALIETAHRRMLQPAM